MDADSGCLHVSTGEPCAAGVYGAQAGRHLEPAAAAAYLRDPEELEQVGHLYGGDAGWRGHHARDHLRHVILTLLTGARDLAHRPCSTARTHHGYTHSASAEGYCTMKNM